MTDSEIPKKDRWKVWMGNMGILPFVVALLAAIFGFIKGQSVSDASWSRRFEAETDRWERLSIQAQKNAERQTALALDEAKLAHGSELQKRDAIILGLQQKIGSLSAAQKLALAVGESPDKHFLLDEASAREYAANLGRQSHWEFIVPRPDGDVWQPAESYSFDQLRKFVDNETLSLGPPEGDIESGLPIHQRIFWGHTLSTKDSSAMVGLLRSNRNTLVAIAGAVAEEEGEELPDNVKRLPIGIHAATVALATLYGKELVLESITAFDASLDSFHISWVLKDRDRIVRLEFVAVESRGMIYGIFSTISSSSALDTNVAFVRRWLSEARIAAELK